MDPSRRLRGRLGGLALTAAGRVVRMPAVGDIPVGRTLELPGRGATYAVDTGTPTGAEKSPVLILLHALACTGLLTWYPCLPALAKRYRVVVFDQRWHGRGIRSPEFSVTDCADDAAAVADALGIDRFVCAGYSLGSLVAQTTAHRHGDRVSGLVLCASTTHFADDARDQRRVERVGARLARVADAQRRFAAEAMAEIDDGRDERWAWRQFRSTGSRAIASSATVIARFDSRPWISDVDVPSAVVVTGRDRLVPPARQRALARALGATAYEVDAGHAACVLAADRFTPAMLAATASVMERARVPR
jgi:pimeloyl-ACP methyl ester carboxylesterase